MLTEAEERRALQTSAELEPPLAAVEAQLGALALALNRQDMVAIDQAATQLHAALAAAVEHFSRAARTGGVPAGLRQRLVMAGGQVAAQREALARATASLDRAMDVLLPRQAHAGMYSSLGSADRSLKPNGSLQA